MLLTFKYAPKRLDDIIGNEEQLAKIRQWILNWITGNKRRPLLVNGPPGCGKTSIAYAIRHEFDFDVIEMGPDRLRNKDSIDRILYNTTLASSLTSKGKIILVDDLDILTRSDYGAIGELTKIIKENRVPIILTVINAWDKKLAPIRAECERIDMKKVNRTAIKKLLEKVASLEKIHLAQEKIDEISTNAQGDVRAALNDLESGGASKRDREIDIFQKIRAIFKSESYGQVKEVTYGKVDYDILKLWIDENIAYEYEDRTDVANAYNYLSRADIFDGRIKNQYWNYLKYSIDLSTAGVSLAKKKVYRKFTKYSFPSYLKNMSKTVQTRALLKRLGSKIGRKLHTNRKTALEYIPLIREFGKGRAEEIELFYGLEEEETAYLMDTSVHSMRKHSIEK